MYLFIFYDLSVVCYISDRVGVMYFGKMMELIGKYEFYDNLFYLYI